MEPTCLGLGPKWQPLQVGGPREVCAGAGRGGDVDGLPQVPEEK